VYTRVFVRPLSLTNPTSAPGPSTLVLVLSWRHSSCALIIHLFLFEIYMVCWASLIATPSSHLPQKWYQAQASRRQVPKESDNWQTWGLYVSRQTGVLLFWLEPILRLHWFYRECWVESILLHHGVNLKALNGWDPFCSWLCHLCDMNLSSTLHDSVICVT